MPSADFRELLKKPYDLFCLDSKFKATRGSPEVSSTAFLAHPPDLQCAPLDGYGLRDPPFARPDRPASHPVFVHRVANLLHASFRRRLAETPLRLASTSPPSGCAGDFHPQAVEHARHTVARVLEPGWRSHERVRLQAHRFSEVQVLSRVIWHSVTESNCVVARRGGEQLEVNDQPVTHVNPIRHVVVASLPSYGEAQLTHGLWKGAARELREVRYARRGKPRMHFETTMGGWERDDRKVRCCDVGRPERHSNRCEPAVSESERP